MTKPCNSNAIKPYSFDDTDTIMYGEGLIFAPPGWLSGCVRGGNSRSMAATRTTEGSDLTGYDRDPA